MSQEIHFPLGRIMLSPLQNFVESFIDNVIRDKISSPAIGSMVYCDLLSAEHSGIYIGRGKIVHLDGGGVVEAVPPALFLERLDGLNTAISIYASCNGNNAVGNPKIAERARTLIGTRKDYHILFDNCHQFTAGCLTGNFKNNVNSFSTLKQLTERILSADTWRVWDY